MDLTNELSAAIAARRPLIMGILNVTPDSFSDGGVHASVRSATDHALAMIEQGADIIDVGPESTRPGAELVSADEQIARAVPVIESIRQKHSLVGISIDTRLASVAQAAIEAGANMVNDVSALRDDDQLADVVAREGVSVCLMHMRGSPANMQRGGGPSYDDLIEEIIEFLRLRIQYAIDRGIDKSKIILDPGIGFGKRVEHNLQIVRQLDRFCEMGFPVLFGASRKSFIGTILGLERPSDRLAGSLACAIRAAQGGAAILRVHDVRETHEATRLCTAIDTGYVDKR